MRGSVGVAGAVLAMAAGAALAGEFECEPTGATQAFTWQSTCASSYLEPQGANRYRIAQAMDGDPATAWCEGVAGPGIGEVLSFNWENAVRLYAVHLANGYGKSAESFAANGRVREVELRLWTWPAEEPLVWRETLADSPGEQMLRMPPFDDPRELQIVILSVWPGSRWEDTCVSEIWADFGF